MDGSTWHNPGLMFQDPAGFVDQEETSRLDYFGRESTSMEWTDEKHSLYLTSIEASFVEELYNSQDSLRWRTQKGRGLDAGSSRQSNVRVTREIKKSYKSDIQPEIDGYCKLENPWTSQCRGRGKPDTIPYSIHGNGGFTHQPLNYGGESSDPSVSQNMSSCSDGKYHQLSNWDEEVSDQNFVDEGNEPDNQQKDKF